MAEMLHIRPWEHELLTVEQFHRAIAYIDHVNEEAKKARAQADQRR